MKKIAIYAGSFDPFHKGHQNIVDKAKLLFDDVIVAQGHNFIKQPAVEKECGYKGKVVYYNLLLTDMIKEIQRDNLENEYFLIRGLRNSKDFEYESEQSYWIKQLMPELQIIYIECDEEYKHISSTAIRQLNFHKQDITHLLP